jgi:phosphoserine phosphatase RsbU/P
VTSGPALLLVDDNDDNRYTLTRRLQREGYTNLAEAADGNRALELLRVRPFDLVLLDVMMPGLNGYEVLERMRADDRLRHVPVIMISALDEIDSVIRCIALGAEDYLAKPFNPTLLRARVGASLEKKRLRDEIVAALDQVENELRSAREVQLGMVPNDFPSAVTGPVEVFATLEPARQIGGDLYDFFWGDDGRFYFVVADVSDKGAPAALFMARTKTMIRLVATLSHTGAEAPPAPDGIIAKVNQELCLDNRQGMFVTVFFGILDPATALVTFCNAGHNSPYVLRGAHGVTALDGPRGKPLGIRPSFVYETGTCRLDPGDCLFLFTDGITEAMDPAGEWFSEERLQQALQPLASAPVREIVGAIIARVRAFTGTAPQADDIAAMAIRRARATRIEISIANRARELPRVAQLLDRLGADCHLGPEPIADMQVALDEILTNVTKYAYADDAEHRIQIRLRVLDGVLEATIEDDGAPFDTLAIPAPDVSAPLHERRVGGVGIHFVRSLMDDVTYDRVGGRNRLVLRKHVTP